MRGQDIIGTFNHLDKKPVDEIKQIAAALDEIKQIAAALDEIKQIAAALVDLVILHGKNARHNAIAITHIETAAMFAVKSIFTPDGKIK